MDAKTEETGPVELRDFSLEHYDTTQALAHAAEQAIQRKYEDFLIVDVDSHHYEFGSVSRDRGVHRRPGAAARRRPSGPGEARHGRRQRLLSGAQRPHHSLSWPPQGENARRSPTATLR